MINIYQNLKLASYQSNNLPLLTLGHKIIIPFCLDLTTPHLPTFKNRCGFYLIVVTNCIVHKNYHDKDRSIIEFFFKFGSIHFIYLSTGLFSRSLLILSTVPIFLFLLDAYGLTTLFFNLLGSSSKLYFVFSNICCFFFFARYFTYSSTWQHH